MPHDNSIDQVLLDAAAQLMRAARRVRRAADEQALGHGLAAGRLLSEAAANANAALARLNGYEVRK